MHLAAVSLCEDAYHSGLRRCGAKIAWRERGGVHSDDCAAQLRCLNLAWRFLRMVQLDVGKTPREMLCAEVVV